ncbi:MFS transporter [Pendulispora brunnea]|uniref:MFS transporter n=1 Tax=Pendulispora brunnea TaxID=2905690 RepID=A0ABZ2K158_9BACT
MGVEPFHSNHGDANDSNDANDGARAVRRATARIVPFLVLSYVLNFLDRVNVGYAALTMNADLGMSATAFGLGAGIFFVGYALFEVPSNLILHRVGAKFWISRIMVTWGLISASTAFVHDTTGFYIVRVLLGVAEAGLFPGVILYLSYWFPAKDRARITALFLFAIPLAQVLGAPLSALILHTNGWYGWQPWRWMFLLEGIPAVLVGVLVFAFLPDRPARAMWLPPAERDWLVRRLDMEHDAVGGHPSLWRAMLDPRVLILSLAYLGVVYALYTVSFFLPQLIRDLAKERGTTLSPLEIAARVAVVYAVAAVSMWWWSRRSDRAAERIWHVATPAFLGVLAFVPIAAMPSSTLAVLSGVVILSIGTFAALPPFWALPPTMFVGSALAAGIGLINSFGNLGGFLGPYVTGWLKDLTGSFHASLFAASGTLVFAGLAVLTLGKLARVVRPAVARA